MQCNAEYSISIYCLCKHIEWMSYKNNNTVDDYTLVEDYMTVTTVTMNFKNTVLDIAKRMLVGNISSIAITDDKEKIIGIITERDVVKIIVNELPPRGGSLQGL
jgi:predicted transcriptional regulator